MRPFIGARLLRKPLAWLTSAVAGGTLLMSPGAPAAPPNAANLGGVVRQYHFQRAVGIHIPVLSADAFQQGFGRNPRVPKSDRDVLALSRHLRLARLGTEAASEPCGEGEEGALMAALSNPEVSDAARGAVDADAAAGVPDFPQTYQDGHFRFFYTTNDPDPSNNVTLPDVKETCKALNAAWTTYSAVFSFRTPMHYDADGQQLIDVKVYNLGPKLLGQTTSSWDYIELNARNVVANPWERTSTSVHELFHRVEYTYGYQSGEANMKWAVEGTAVWASYWLDPNHGSWIDWVNTALNNPDVPLLERDYDTILFWLFLDHVIYSRSHVAMPPVARMWGYYEGNGHDMVGAVNLLIKDWIDSGSDLNSVSGTWLYTNYVTELSNAPSLFHYSDQNLTLADGTNIHGPFAPVARQTILLTGGKSFAAAGTVSTYGADYFEFNIGMNQKATIEVGPLPRPFGGASKLSYAVLEIKNNAIVSSTGVVQTGASGFSFSKTYNLTPPDKIVVMLLGNPAGGTYSIVASGESHLPPRITIPPFR